MNLRDLQLPPPVSWADFENLCLALFRAEWQDSSADLVGRRGQGQHGVDVFGKKPDGRLAGVQCKCKDNLLGSQLTFKEITGELHKADQFQPQLSTWIIATTTARHAPLQEQVRLLNAERTAQGKFACTLVFWDGLKELLERHQQVAREFYSFLFEPDQNKPLHLPATKLTAHFSDPLNHLGRLRAFLQVPNQQAIVLSAAVQGMGGVGKTQLALQYSTLYRQDYAGVWWFAAEHESTLLQDGMMFCAQRGIVLPEPQLAPHAIRDWLVDQPRWLLVFDNAEDESMLQNWLPQVGRHHVLVTSRQPDWQAQQSLKLDVWDENQALPFLLQRLPGQDEADLCALCRALDGLPLALEQACAYVRRHRVRVADYVSWVQDLTQAPLLLARTDAAQCPRSVLACLSLAFDKLSKPARALLGVCGWLAAAPIPEFLFTENPKNLDDHLPTALQNLSARHWREIVAELEGHGLCERKRIMLQDHVGNGDEEVDALQFHRLTQAAVRATGHDYLDAAVWLLRAAFPFDTSFPANWPHCYMLQSHLQIMYDWRVVICSQQNLGWLLGQLASYLEEGALYPVALHWHQQSLVITEDAFGAEHTKTLIAMAGLASTLARMGRLPEALELQEKVLAVRRRLLGEENAYTLTAMHNLAAVFWQMGELAKARALNERLVEIRLRVLGEEHPDSLISLNNLATTLLELGKLREAYGILKKMFPLVCHVYGEGHPNTFSAMNNIASTLVKMGHFAKARGVQESLLQRCRNVQGEEHPSTLGAMNNLAVTLESLGKLAEAEALYSQALAIACSIWGLQHTEAQKLQQNLIRLHEKM